MPIIIALVLLLLEPFRYSIYLPETIMLLMSIFGMVSAE